MSSPLNANPLNANPLNANPLNANDIFQAVLKNHIVKIDKLLKNAVNGDNFHVKYEIYCDPTIKPYVKVEIIDHYASDGFTITEIVSHHRADEYIGFDIIFTPTAKSTADPDNVKLVDEVIDNTKRADKREAMSKVAIAIGEYLRIP